MVKGLWIDLRVHWAITIAPFLTVSGPLLLYLCCNLYSSNFSFTSFALRSLLKLGCNSYVTKIHAKWTCFVDRGLGQLRCDLTAECFIPHTPKKSCIYSVTLHAPKFQLLATTNFLYRFPYLEHVCVTHWMYACLFKWVWGPHAHVFPLCVKAWDWHKIITQSPSSLYVEAGFLVESLSSLTTDL